MCNTPSNTNLRGYLQELDQLLTNPSPYIPSKQNQHQALLTTVHSKLVFAHLNPFAGCVQVYDLEQDEVRTGMTIKVDRGLCQMQVCDNLLVIHNIDLKTTQIHDIKLDGYDSNLMSESGQIRINKAIKGKLIMDLIKKDDARCPEEALSSRNANKQS